MSENVAPVASAATSTTTMAAACCSKGAPATPTAADAPAVLITDPKRLENIPLDVTLELREVCDLEMFTIGAFHPLNGYLNYRDFCSVVQNCRLADGGAVWPMPFVLPVKNFNAALEETKVSTAAGGEGDSTQQTREGTPSGAVPTHKVNVRDVFGTVLAVVTVEDVYVPNLEVMCKYLLGTYDDNHPYVSYLLHSNHTNNCVYVGGKIEIVHPIIHFDFKDFRVSAEESRKMIKDNGWETVVGFQTRNPMHRSHFELTVHALKEAEKLTGKRPTLLLTPAGGPTQPGDVPPHVRIRCYKKLLPKYAEMGYEARLVLLPLAMRMAGPREALWHALIRKNFGCTHFIVGRDHAGPSRKKKDGTAFYEPYAAHELLEKMKGDIGISPIFGRSIVYAGEELGYVQEDQLPAGVTALALSGTRFREMLTNREEVPEWFSFRPVVEVLQRLYRKRQEQGICIYFTGLPCSGKSTLAEATQASIYEREDERRQVTLLDADLIRTHLSKGLGFSKEDRSANVQRIGFVAAEVAKHGGICLVANIAPYREDRKINRQLVESSGGAYIEVHVSTPLEVCETRDVKGFFKKARVGVIKNFTGINDPYESPENPELSIDSTKDVKSCVNSVISYLVSNSYLSN